MPQLGKATIEVRADLSKFPADLKEQLKRALKEGVAGIDFKDLENAGEKAGEEVANQIGGGVEKKSKTRLKKSGEKAAEDVGLGLFGTLKKIFSSNGGGSGFFSTVGDLFSGFTKSAENGIDQLQSGAKQIQEIGGKIGNAFSAIGSGIQVGMYIAAVPAVGALIAVLVQLSGILFLLPAAVGVAVAAIAPLLIAFQGISEAIGAGFSGDVDKFNAALKGLAPSARAVVKEIVGLKPAFEAIKGSTQQAFFAPLVGSFKALGGTLLPALQKDLSLSAGALGDFAAKFLSLLSDPEIIGDINKLFATTARIIEQLAPVASDFFGSLFGLMETGLPYVEKFAGYFAEAGQKLTDLIGRAQGAGKIKDFISSALIPLREIGKLLAVTGDLFFTIFGNSGVQKAGDDFLGYLVKAIGLLDKFFKSAEGKKVLKDFADAIEHTGVLLVGLAGILIGVLEALHYINAGLQIAVKAVGEFFQAVGKYAVVAAKAIGHFFETFGTAVADFFTKTIPDAFHAVVSFFSSVGSAIADFFTKTIPDAFNAVVKFFEDSPKRVGGGLESLGATIRDKVESAMFAFRDLVFRGIGQVIGLFLAVPTLVQRALSFLTSTVVDAFTSTFDASLAVVSHAIDAIGHYFSHDLVGQIEFGLTFVYNFVTSQFEGLLAYFESLGPKIGRFFTGIYHSIVDNVGAAARDAKNFAVEGFNSLVSFVSGLPGRIAALGPKMLSAARDLGRQIGNGLKEVGSFASNIGADIVAKIKSGLNSIIHSINSGINSVGGSLHISLPNLPGLAKGGVIDSPTIALLGEGSRKEVVVPLTDPARAQQLAQQSGLTKILAGGGGSPIVNITAILGTGQILEILDQRVSTAMDNQGSELAFGAR